jgi:thioredoxin 1
MANSPLPLIALGAAAFLLSQGGGEKAGSRPAPDPEPGTGPENKPRTPLPIKVYDLWAEWCGPCRQYTPIFLAVSAANPDIEFVRINIDEDPSMFNSLGLQGIPATVIEIDGEVVHKELGLLDVPGLQNLIDQARDQYLAQAQVSP